MNNRTGTLSWVHFGDLHIRARDEENYSDFLDLIDAANHHLAGAVDFALLPGDNADDGTESEYRLIREALQRLKIPVHVISGDHDRKAGTLDLFQQYLQPELYRSLTIKNFRLLFLNAMDGEDHQTFDLGSQQFEWLRKELATARTDGLRAVLFVHLYPSEMSTKGKLFSELIRNQGVELVEMGHTHYNELANDGQVLYAATRSTGQIEEGPPGFSLTVINEDVISWKFKERGPWPFVMIVSPSDHRLITDPLSPRQVVNGPVTVRAKAWDCRGIASAACSIDKAPPQSMTLAENGYWQLMWNPHRHGDGLHSLRIEVVAVTGERAYDDIVVLVSQAASYGAPPRQTVDYENVLGPWPEKGILGTQLGPNENGTKGPWPSWRGR